MQSMELIYDVSWEYNSAGALTKAVLIKGCKEFKPKGILMFTMIYIGDYS